MASGGTAKFLKERGIPALDITTIVGNPIFGHQVVTLSTAIHGPLLSRDIPEEAADLERLPIPRIDLLYVNLYLLEQEINKPAATSESVIEMTDVGGPAMVHSAVKGGRIVVCDEEDIPRVIVWLMNQKPEQERFLTYLRAKAELVVGRYILMSGFYHASFLTSLDPEWPVMNKILYDVTNTLEQVVQTLPRNEVLALKWCCRNCHEEVDITEEICPHCSLKRPE
ncbi:MAG: hypothetical protein V1712_02405 [Patescibacteria group bacterium]